ncbi:hypothetical protein Avbf_01872 [Armadillidium vulgare]|nr:hypothetical protein Avbf_01872 [Armadillidium vulgare]
MEEIRVVDFSRAAKSSLKSNCEEDLKEVSKEIVECFENIGFAYIKNHGIPQEISQKNPRMSVNYEKVLILLESPIDVFQMK